MSDHRSLSTVHVYVKFEEGVKDLSPLFSVTANRQGQVKGDALL